MAGEKWLLRVVLWPPNWHSHFSLTGCQHCHPSKNASPRPQMSSRRFKCRHQCKQWGSKRGTPPLLCLLKTILRQSWCPLSGSLLTLSCSHLTAWHYTNRAEIQPVFWQIVSLPSPWQHKIEKAQKKTVTQNHYSTVCVCVSVLHGYVHDHVYTWWGVPVCVHTVHIKVRDQHQASFSIDLHLSS